MFLSERMKPRVSNWFVAPGPLLRNIHCMPISNLEKGFKYLLSVTGCRHLT